MVDFTVDLAWGLTCNGHGRGRDVGACILPLAWKIAMGGMGDDGFACHRRLLCYTRRRAGAAIWSLANALKNGRPSALRFVVDLLRGRIAGCHGKLNA